MEKSIFKESSEFGFIGKLQQIMADSNENKQIPVGIGDDCAIVNYERGQYVHTTDVLVEGVHYNLKWSSWSEVIHKACIASLSDINAMGAMPSHMLVSLGLQKKWGSSYQNEFISEISAVCKKYGVALIGGDTVSSPMSFINISMTGILQYEPLLRSNAQEGQSIYVSGTLGDSAAGLSIFEKNRQRSEFPKLIKKHTAGMYPVGLGTILSQANEAVGCMDISDGISSELHHISEQSNVKMRIYENLIPISEELLSFSQKHNESLCKFWLNGGEEYELLFTINESNAILNRIEDHCIVTKIGEVLPGSGVELIGIDGQIQKVAPSSYAHF